MFIVDRIEGEFLIIEGEAEPKNSPIFFQIPRILLPDAKEGDCLEISINHEATREREKRIGRLMDSLFTD